MRLQQEHGHINIHDSLLSTPKDILLLSTSISSTLTSISAVDAHKVAHSQSMATRDGSEDRAAFGIDVLGFFERHFAAVVFDNHGGVPYANDILFL